MRSRACLSFPLAPIMVWSKQKNVLHKCFGRLRTLPSQLLWQIPDSILEMAGSGKIQSQQLPISYLFFQLHVKYTERLRDLPEVTQHLVAGVLSHLASTLMSATPLILYKFTMWESRKRTRSLSQIFNYDASGWEYFGTGAGRKPDPNALAPDAQMLCRIPGKGRHQVLISC